MLNEEFLYEKHLEMLKNKFQEISLRNTRVYFNVITIDYDFVKEISDHF